jgi:hypothetical protein
MDLQGDGNEVYWASEETSELAAELMRLTEELSSLSDEDSDRIEALLDDAYEEFGEELLEPLRAMWVAFYAGRAWERKVSGRGV